jgi:hypothetical protein
MKKIQLLIITTAIITSIIFTQEANATIWRVNNKSNYNGSTLYGENFGGSPACPVFAQINQAVAFGIVNSGDTIHVEGSTTTYDVATITKQLVIIGTGYLLTDNPNTSNTALETKLSRIIFNVGSESSQLIGVSVVSAGNVADATVYVNVNGVVVKRCRIDNGVEFGTGLVDIYILQNFFSNTSVSNALLTNGNVFLYLQPK